MEDNQWSGLHVVVTPSRIVLEGVTFEGVMFTQVGKLGKLLGFGGGRVGSQQAYSIWQNRKYNVKT